MLAHSDRVLVDECAGAPEQVASLLLGADQLPLGIAARVGRGVQDSSCLRQPGEHFRRELGPEPVLYMLSRSMFAQKSDVLVLAEPGQ